MSLEFNRLVHPYVQNLKPYLPGKSIVEVQEQYHIQEVIKLASNENAWGTSQKVLQAIQQTQMDDICLYPNTYLHPFFRALQQQLEIPQECLFLSAGSDAIFSLLMQAYACPQQKNILTHQYAFMGYEIQAHAHGLNCLKASVDPNTWDINLDELLIKAQNNVAITFIANPNNPTGNLLTWDTIQDLLRQIPPQSLFVVDQAYLEYDPQAQPHVIELIQNFPHLILTRTFSKAYGLASLRLGYAIAHPEVIQTLKKIQLPFTVSQISLNAGLAALTDEDFVKHTVMQTASEKQYLIQQLNPFPFDIQHGYGNFITIKNEKNIPKLVHYLESHGIIIRPLNSFGMHDCARITIGRREQNLKLIHTLHRYYQS